MKKMSEKELEDRYREQRMKDVPSMWDEIEKNLAPKESASKNTIPFRKRIPVKQLSAVAAILVVAVLLVSVLKPLWESAHSEKADMSMEGDNSKWDSQYAENKELQDSVNSTEPSNENLVQPDMEMEAVIQLKVQVKSVQTASENAEQYTGGGFRITAEVLDGGNSSYLPDDEIIIYYYGSDYGTDDLTGTLTLQLEESEEILKLLKILP